MRVLHVVPWVASRTGGPAKVIVELCVALKAQGVECVVFATNARRAHGDGGHLQLDDLPAGSELVRLRLFPLRWPQRLFFAPDLYSALGREVGTFDVVHIHSLFLFPQFAAYMQAFRHRVPYLVSPHGALDPYLRRRGRLRKRLVSLLWQKKLLERAALLHFTSADEARLAADIAPGVPRVIVPNGIRSSAYQQLPAPSLFRDRFCQGARGPLIVNTGRLSQKKGLDTLIRAFALVLRDLPDARLALVGPDDEGLTPRLRAIASQEGVEGRVFFTGMLRGDDLLGALSAADVWALSSHSENFGNAVVEAMCAGVPVVVSEFVNISSAIASAGAGVVSPLDANAFARHIANVLRQPGLAARLRQNAKAYSTRFDWTSVSTEYKSMYSLAATARSAGPQHSSSV